MKHYLNFSSFREFQSSQTKHINFKKIHKYLSKKKINKIEFSVPKVFNKIDEFNYYFEHYTKILNFNEIKNKKQIDDLIVFSDVFKSKKIRIKFSNNLEFKINNEKNQKKNIEKFIAIINSKLSDLRNKKICLLLENHQDLDSDDLQYILNNIQSKYFGLCFDIGNSLSTLESPYHYINKFKKRIKHVHLKNYVLKKNNKKLILSQIDLEKGIIDIHKVYSKIKKLNKTTTFSIEIANWKNRVINLNNNLIKNRIMVRSNYRNKCFNEIISVKKNISSYMNSNIEYSLEKSIKFANKYL